ncbi:MAG TPA: glutathione S-transferase family protein, partial [SAR86 cluster bacterium]|nr:glutathione S-transferase family protein [SAR86 cluster bacterium]
MTIKIYGTEASRATRPIWTAEEMGLDYELEMMPFPPRVFKPEYLEINMLG